MINPDYDSKINHLIEQALLEDIGTGDVTTGAIVPAGTIGMGNVVVKEAGVIAGLAVAERLFKFIEPELVCTTLAKDGASVEEGAVAMTIDGHLASILKG